MYRRAEVRDIAQLIDLRFALQREVGYLTDPSVEPRLAEITRKYFGEMIPTGTFAAWVAETPEGKLVAANGVVFYEKPPSARGMSGRVAYVSNVYTLPEWRGKGISTALMKLLIEHARERQAVKIELEATEAGRKVYEKLGFTLKRYPGLEYRILE